NSITLYGDFCDNCNLSGNDIQRLSSSSFEACWISCLDNQYCTHLAFEKSNKNCWLKNKPKISFSKSNLNYGAMSAIMDRSKNCTNAYD
ncbi:unnamed protein product, partial [Brachionus calyciflorus]